MLFTKEQWKELFSEIRGDAELERMSRNAMSEPIYTVTKKLHVLPKDAVPNDYVSIAPYWWPDPEKADGLPWIRRDGETNPMFYEYDANTIYNFTVATQTLLLAGIADGRKECAERAVEQVESWFINPSTRMNPNMRHAQFVPGREDGRCYGIIDAREFPGLFELLELLPFECGWTPAKLEAVRAWTSDFMHWMLTHPLGVQEGRTLNNHAINYDCMISSFSLFVGDSEFAANYLRERCLPRIDQQFAEDGSMPLELERTDSKGYSTFALMCFLHAAVIGRSLGVAFPKEKLARGLSWLEANVNSSEWKWRQIVPYRGISPRLYQFGWMFFDDKALLSKARTASKNPWDRMVEIRKRR